MKRKEDDEKVNIVPSQIVYCDGQNKRVKVDIDSSHTIPSKNKPRALSFLYKICKSCKQKLCSWSLQLLPISRNLTDIEVTEYYSQ